jgi:hypothetical protein
MCPSNPINTLTTTVNAYGWRQDEPCPEWCTSTDHHLQERLIRGTDHFWHSAEPIHIDGSELSPHDEPYTVECFVSQHVHVDERGYWWLSGEVVVAQTTLTPARARDLAAVLTDLADQAEALPICERPS